MKPFSTFPPAFVLLAALVAASPAGAQSKPADAKLPTLGGGGKNAGAKVLSRDELRACMQQQSALRTRGDELQAERKALDAEKAELLQTTEALKAERAAIDARNGSITDLNERMRAQGVKVESWNARWAKANEAGRVSDTQRGEFERERVALQEASTALDAERGALAESLSGAVKGLNAKSEPHDQRVTAWNERNAKAEATAQAVQADQNAWSADCSGRRYREDDEKALRNAK